MPPYLRTLALTLATMLAATVLFCGLVDPYGVIGAPATALTVRKPAAADRPRMTKPMRIERMDPAAIVTGSSAANIGFDPESPVWPAPDRPVYNLGIDGALPTTQRRFLQHALVRATPRLVVLPISFEDMMLAPRTIRSAGASDPIAFENRLRVLSGGAPNPAYRLARLHDLAFATLSFTALADSIRTLRSQHDPGAGAQSAQGFDDRVRFAGWVALDGLDSLLRGAMGQRLREVRGSMAVMDDEIAALAAMVRDARQNGADALVLITPTYLAGLEVRRRLGLSERSQAWLASLATALEAVADATGGRDHVAIWNFEGYDTSVQQPLPPPGTHAPLRWFWEIIHFRAELGALMVARALDGNGPPGFGAPGFGAPGFGERLTAATAPDQARRYHAAETAWQAANPADAARIGAMLQETAKTVCAARPLLCRTPIALLP